MKRQLVYADENLTNAEKNTRMSKLPEREYKIRAGIGR